MLYEALLHFAFVDGLYEFGSIFRTYHFTFVFNYIIGRNVRCQATKRHHIIVNICLQNGFVVWLIHFFLGEGLGYVTTIFQLHACETRTSFIR